MWKASFPMHVEDTNAYSLNFLHFDAEKVWFSIPRKSFSELEKILPDYYKSCSKYLLHKSTIFGIDVMNFQGKGCINNTRITRTFNIFKIPASLTFNGDSSISILPLLSCTN